MLSFNQVIHDSLLKLFKFGSLAVYYECRKLIKAIFVSWMSAFLQQKRKTKQKLTETTIADARPHSSNDGLSFRDRSCSSF